MILATGANGSKQNSRGRQAKEGYLGKKKLEDLVLLKAFGHAMYAWSWPELSLHLMYYIQLTK